MNVRTAERCLYLDCVDMHSGDWAVIRPSGTTPSGLRRHARQLTVYARPECPNAASSTQEHGHCSERNEAQKQGILNQVLTALNTPEFP
jgi:hypothetical protein